MSTNSIRPLENGKEEARERDLLVKAEADSQCVCGSKTASLNNNNNENSLGFFLVIKS